MSRTSSASAGVVAVPAAVRRLGSGGVRRSVGAGRSATGRAEAARRRRAAACRPCRGRSRRRTRAPRRAWPAAALLVEDGDVGAGEHEVLDRRRGRRSASAGTIASSTEPKQRRRRTQRLAGLAQLVLGADDARRAGAPTGSARRAGSRPAASRPPGLQHPGDLGQRPVVVEPVERLRGHHDVVRRVRRRGSPRRDATEVRTSGSRSRSTRQHRVVGVGGVHVVAERDQRLGQLAGAGAELEDGDRLGRRPARRRPRRGSRAGRGRRRRRRSRRSGRGRAGHSSGSPYPLR